MFPSKDINQCTGCGACVTICPKSCIVMQEDDYGALIPHIDTDKCVKCGLCEAKCPANNIPNYKYPTKCFAAWNEDQKCREISASGGLGYLFSKYVIEEKNGVAFGVAYNDDMLPVVKGVKTIDELEAFKGSKYVQAILDKTIYEQVKRLLEDGRFVLFVGTPCQISGLYSTLGKMDIKNLITVDLICHGVSPTRYYIEEVRQLTKGKPWKIINVRFRGNDDDKYSIGFLKKIFGIKYKGNNYCLTLWIKNKRGDLKRVYQGDRNHNMYLRGFLDGITLRENCYTCKYAKPERIADITLGDFIGLGDSLPFPFSKENVSSVFINTDKGSLFYSELLSKYLELHSIERPYKERLEYRSSLLEPFVRHPLNEKFKVLYLKMGYVKTMRHILGHLMMRERFKLFVNYWGKLPFRIMRKLLQKIGLRK